MKYGCYFNLSRWGVWLMVNGRMFTVHRSANTGRWKGAVWDNCWRATRTPLPC